MRDFKSLGAHERGWTIRIGAGGSDGRRSRDLTIFSRALYQLSYRADVEYGIGEKPYPTERNAPS